MLIQWIAYISTMNLQFVISDPKATRLISFDTVNDLDKYILKHLDRICNYNISFIDSDTGKENGSLPIDFYYTRKFAINTNTN
jgi:hypothetical protein